MIILKKNIHQTKTAKPKRGKICAGDAFSVPLGPDEFGYCQAQKTDRAGALFAIFSEKHPGPLPWESFSAFHPSVLSFAYINSAVPKKEWGFFGNFRVVAPDSRIPPFFYGSSTTRWTVRYPDGTEKYVRAIDKNYEAMLSAGFCHEVLWLGPSIVAHIKDKRPLLWDGPV